MRPEKVSIVKDIHERLADSSYVILADYSGLTVAGISDLRGQLRAAKSRFTVVKNSFLRRAMADLGWNGVASHVDGATAMITGDGDVTQIAKILETFAKEHEKPSMRGGRVGEDVLGADEVRQLAKIPPREVLLGQLVGTIAAPLSQVVGVLNQKVASVLYVLKAIEEKKSKG